MIRKILIVTGADGSRESLANVFRNEYSVALSRTGDEALACVSSSIDDYAAVVLDMSVSDIDGFSVLENIRANKECATLCVVALGDAADEERVLELGANEFSKKPLDTSDVKMRVARCVALREAGDALGADLSDLERTEDQRVLLLDNLPCGAAMFTFDGETLRPIHLNKRYWELVGRSNELGEDSTLLNRVHPEDVDNLKSEIVEALRGNGFGACDIRLQHGDGEYHAYHVDARFTKQPNGIYLVYAVYTPISNAAMSLRETLTLALSTVISSSNDLVYLKDRRLRYIACNKAFVKFAGIKSDQEAIGRTVRDFFSQDYAEKNVNSEASIIETKTPQIDYEVRVPSPSGEVWYGLSSKYPLLDRNGEAIGLYCVIRDTTRTRELDSRLRLLNDTIPCGIVNYTCFTDKLSLDNVKVTYFNDGMCELFDCTREEFIENSRSGASWLVNDDERPKLADAINKLIRTGSAVDITYKSNVKNGVYKWINQKLRLVDKEDGFIRVSAVLQDVTEKHEMMEMLRISEEENRLALQHGGSMVCRFTVKSRELSMPEHLAIKYGINRTITGVPQKQIDDGWVSPESGSEYTRFYEGIIAGTPHDEAVYQFKMPQGWRWLEAHQSTIFSADGEPNSAIVSFFDVTERIEQEAIARMWHQSLSDRDPSSYTMYRCIISRDATYDTVEGSLLDYTFDPDKTNFNERARDYARERVYPDDRDSYIAFADSERMQMSYYRGKRIDSLEYRVVLADGTKRWRKLTAELVELPGTSDIAAYLLYEDIDVAKSEEIHTRILAETDSLTGLLNRVTFIDRISELMKQRHADRLSALMILDLDDFKKVNDSFGHAVGDETLIEVAQKIAGLVRSGDLVCRLGGDEFMIYLHNVPNKGIIATKARQVCAALRKSFSMEIQLSVSIGIAVNPIDGEDFEELYHKSDLALYNIKSNGKAVFGFYDEEMVSDIPYTQETVEEPVTPFTKTGELKRRMLIVEDSKSNRDMLVGIFKNDYLVETAENGMVALTRMRRAGSSISVVLLDIMMPEMDGFEVLDRMQENPELCDIPVIVVSGADESEASQRALKCGAFDFITKPVDAKLLRTRVQSAVSKVENARLRAQNMYLSLRNDEIDRYRTILELGATVFAEYDPAQESFTYDRSMSLHLAGQYNNRTLWQIFTEDGVADKAVTDELVRLVAELIPDPSRVQVKAEMNLLSAAGDKRVFVVKVMKRIGDFDEDNRVLLTFTEKLKQ